ncbi:hypothetical protein [Paraburkholderia antibiotica]|uniref:Uncharacterized protein n=1 Tax=Paraburkholderia antibiotica TaxID=2728839 RepID=A0A7X9X425_9BURK|nr:hypothetical protein [Paraburkholderia antibiotica]NML30844.1 hypothetical protein [Paraburkholderia antibiotica]
MEHRIVFSRVLFWFDYKIFGALNVFSVISVFVLMVLLCAALIYENCKNGVRENRWFVGFMTIGLMFSWLQYENFTSGFQSQFISVYLFAMLGFARFSRSDRHRLPMAVLFALMSILSMANGLAVLFVMAVQGVLLKRPRREILSLGLIGAIAAAIYLHGLRLNLLPVPPELAHAHLVSLRYFFIFLGNPATYLGLGNLAAGIFGLLMFAIAAVVVLWLFATKAITPYRSFLIASYGFIIASAIGVAHGRWMIGFDSAHDSRYTTPALLGCVLLVTLLLEVLPRRRVLVATATALFATALLPLQLVTIGHTELMPHFVRGSIYDWKLAVLGAKIGLDHPEFAAKLFPPSAHERFLNQASFAAAMDIGPYASGWLHDAGIVKYDSQLRDDSLCVGFHEHTGTDAIGRNATGWAIAQQYRQPATLIVLTNENGDTVGYGVTGMERKDVAKQTNGPADAGWYGFAKNGPGNLQAFAYVGGKFCSLKSLAN